MSDTVRKGRSGGDFREVVFPGLSMALLTAIL